MLHELDIEHLQRVYLIKTVTLKIKWFITYCAVSYTHLDVYKRQELLISALVFLFDLLMCLAKALVTPGTGEAVNLSARHLTIIRVAN